MAYLGMLPEVPSFKQTLARNLSQGLGQGISTATDFIQKMALKQSENRGLADIFKGSSSSEGFGFRKLTPEKAAQLALQNPQAYKAYQAFEKGQEEEGERTRKQEDLQTAFDDMVNKSEDIGWSLFENPNYSFSGRERAEFESDKPALIAALRDQVNKGVLTNQKFNFIVRDMLPSHKDTTAVKIGKLKGIAKQLRLNTEELDRLYPDVKAMKFNQEKSSNGSELVWMEAPDGSKNQVPKSKVSAAMKAGAKVIKGK